MESLMYTLDRNIGEPLQNGLLSVGIDTWWKAGIALSGLTAIGIHAYKPAAFYSPDGSMRPWNATMDATTAKMTDATPVPVWLASASVGFITASFI